MYSVHSPFNLKNNLSIYQLKQLFIMAQFIGFATMYYTLWDVRADENYIVTPSGHSYLSGYTYYYTFIKNISTDLDKARKLYPDAPFDETLRGKTSSFRTESVADLCPHIMKFGKYTGSDINDLLTSDFDYLLWLCDNKPYTSNGNYASCLPDIIAHKKRVMDEEQSRLDRMDRLLKSIADRGCITITPSTNLRLSSEHYDAYLSDEVSEGDDLSVWVHFLFPRNLYSEHYYRGFSYGLPIINGKAKRIKGKQIRLTFTACQEDRCTMIVSSVELI